MSPLLSVIIVTFRDDSGLQRTLRSLDRCLAEGGGDVEILVVSGEVDPVGARLICSSYPQRVIRVVHGPDAGIYDAMNKGIEASTGAFVWFLNGGDEVHARLTYPELQTQLRANPEKLILAAYELVGTLRQEVRLPRPAWYIRHALPTSHQAIYYPRTGLSGLRYRSDLTIVGDYEFTARLLRDGAEVVVWDRPVARFMTGGISSQRGHVLRSEVAVVQKQLGYPLPMRLLSSLLHTFAARRRGLVG